MAVLRIAFARGGSVLKMKTLIGIITVALISLALSACETTVPKGMHVHPKVGLNTLSKLLQRTISDDDLVGASHRAADSLVKKAGTQLDMQRAVAAASFVNIDNLAESSSFGRIVSQQLASRFADHGVKIIEMLLRKSIYIKQQAGEFLLSRELKNISQEHNVQAAIVGTYAVGKESVYVTAKIVNAANSIVIASHDYELPLGPNTRALLISE